MFRSSKKRKESDLEAGTSQPTRSSLTGVIGKRLPKRQTTEDEWEANWEKGEYPFVKLPNNRATCAICLVDFEAPPKKGTAAASMAMKAVSESSLDSPGASSSRNGGKQNKKRHEKRVQVENLKLEDAGEGAQPLRLLACGHAFHVRSFNYLCSSRDLLLLHSKLVLTPGSLTSLAVVPCANGQSTLRSCVNLPRKVTHPGQQMHLHQQYPLPGGVAMKVVASLNKHCTYLTKCLLPACILW